MGLKSYIWGLKVRKSGQDRRKHPRIRTSLSVLSGESATEEHRHVLLDVSRSGGLLSPNLDLPEEGTTILRLEGGKSAEVAVVRQSVAGTAVMFDTRPESAGLINDLLNLARIAAPCSPEAN